LRIVLVAECFIVYCEQFVSVYFVKTRVRKMEVLQTLKKFKDPDTASNITFKCLAAYQF